MTDVDIGMGKSARQGYGIEQLALVPSRRTRDTELVDLSWQIDAYAFELPFLSSAMDSVTSPTTAIEIGRLGGLGVLDLEGLWTRHEDAGKKLAQLAGLAPAKALALLTKWYKAPVDPDLVDLRIKEVRAGGVYAAGAVSPKRVAALADVLLKAELDLLLIQGTVISAEHVSARAEPLNLKEFVRQVETPVVVGGCASYPAALHLMRTGAAGVLVGIDGGQAATSASVTGLGSPLATAIADVRAARMRHLDETGVYVHVIADGGLRTGGDIAKAIACGADSVMLGAALASSAESPGQGFHWGRSSLHATLPQGRLLQVEHTEIPLEQTLLGPATGSDGASNIFGALRQAMATLGYETVKELQKAEIVLRTGN